MSIPIELPPGTQDMVPSLGISGRVQDFSEQQFNLNERPGGKSVAQAVKIKKEFIAEIIESAFDIFIDVLKIFHWKMNMYIFFAPIVLFLSQCFLIPMGPQYRLIAFTPYTDAKEFPSIKLSIKGNANKKYFFTGKMILSQKTVLNSDIEELPYKNEYSLNNSWMYFRKDEPSAQINLFQYNKEYSFPLPEGNRSYSFYCKTEENEAEMRYRDILWKKDVLSIHCCGNKCLVIPPFLVTTKNGREGD